MRYQRPGFAPKPKKSRKSEVIRVSEKLLEALEVIGAQRGMKIRPLVELAISGFIDQNRFQQHPVVTLTLQPIRVPTPAELIR